MKQRNNETIEKWLESETNQLEKEYNVPVTWYKKSNEVYVIDVNGDYNYQLYNEYVRMTHTALYEYNIALFIKFKSDIIED